jgi:hypothetical protein
MERRHFKEKAMEPNYERILDWAYDPAAAEPYPGWDLALAASSHELLLMACVADDACPRRTYLLRVLYMIVEQWADGVSRHGIDVVQRMIRHAEHYAHPDIRLWQLRAWQLVNRQSRTSCSALFGDQARQVRENTPAVYLPRQVHSGCEPAD